MKILASVMSSERRRFGWSIPRPQPRVVAIQALCLGIVLLDFMGAIMGLSDFVMTFWHHHPFLAIPSTAVAILLFAALIELGIARLRADAS